MALEFTTVLYLLIILTIGAAIGYFVNSLLNKNKNEENKDNVVDADFEDVKEDKEKSA